MKKIFLVTLLLVIVIACKSKKPEENVYKNYPKLLTAVFKKHGGLEHWKQLTTLSFNKGEEAHTVDLHSRKTLIATPNYSYGFDGEKVWVSDSTAFKKDATFYYNLYFYFYAMPFVLADDGLNYQKTPPLQYKNKVYPGYKISYNADKGNSPEDNYYIYVNPTTSKMEWLAYTVTYFSKKATHKRNLINYNKWEMVNGFLLPKELVWYKQDSLGNPTNPTGKPLQFTNALVSQAKLEASFFKKI